MSNDKINDHSTHSGSSVPGADWRIALFGNYIQLNPKSSDDVDVEAQTTLVPTEVALNDHKYDYIAVFIGADYCPHCKAFAPTVNASAEMLEGKQCKVIFASNDRTEEAFEASLKKNAGLDVMPYDLEKTKAMRDLFQLETIPALMILRNADFDEPTPSIVTNARHALVADPEGKFFPWAPHEETKLDADENMSFLDRLMPRGRYGKWWELGHHANPAKPNEIYMDEHAVRIRAGILNVVTYIALMNIWFWRDPIFVSILYPIVAMEFIVSANMGLGPLAPIGFIATYLAKSFHPKPFWKPAKPKRFAWYIGLTLATTCLILFLFRHQIGAPYRPSITAVIVMCNLATWLESSCGFCIGCYMYNNWMVPLFKMEECSECKL